MYELKWGLNEFDPAAPEDVYVREPVPKAGINDGGIEYDVYDDNGVNPTCEGIMDT